MFFRCCRPYLWHRVSVFHTWPQRELLLNAPCLLATKPQSCSLLKLVQKSVHAPDLSKTIRLCIEINNECPKDILSVAVVNVLGIVLNASACPGLSSPLPNWTYSHHSLPERSLFVAWSFLACSPNHFFDAFLTLLLNALPHQAQGSTSQKWPLRDHLPPPPLFTLFTLKTQALPIGWLS